MAFLRTHVWRQLRQSSGIALKVLLSALCVVLILALQSPGVNLSAPARSNRDVATFAPANINKLLSKPNAIEVRVGAYVDNFHDLSLQNRRFVAEGYYWIEWPQVLQDKLVSEKIDPKSIIVLANQVDTWDGQITGASEEPVRLANGNYYQQFQFSANFYIPEINLKRFPFESVQLPVIFEVRDDSLAIQKGNVILVPDTGKNALVGSFAEINGYKITSSVLKPTVHAFGTNLGLNNGDLSYSGVALQATLKSTPLPSILKYFLPLMIVVGIVILAPSLEGELGDIRLAIPSTGLLTLIFLQQAYQAELPELDYLTFLDWIYACGYVISIGTFLLFVWGTNFYQRTPKKGKEQALATINRADTIFQVSAVVGTVVAGLMAWMA
jgi:hypothetical protein